jgi:hypothetical protein
MLLGMDAIATPWDFRLPFIANGSDSIVYVDSLG